MFISFRLCFYAKICLHGTTHALDFLRKCCYILRYWKLHFFTPPPLHLDCLHENQTLHFFRNNLKIVTQLSSFLSYFCRLYTFCFEIWSFNLYSRTLPRLWAKRFTCIVLSHVRRRETFTVNCLYCMIVYDFLCHDSSTHYFILTLSFLSFKTPDTTGAPTIVLLFLKFRNIPLLTVSEFEIVR